jgi:mono/diheme cytochrome c family protein
MVMRLLVLASVLLLVACQSQPTYMPSGEQTYKQYCAACHGADAKGHGPVASVLTTPPPDLTTLAKSHSGKFPYDYVSSVLEFGTASSRNIVSDYAYPAHSSSDMPTWGPIFQYYDKQSERVVQQRIKNLCDYLASLQEI